MRKSKALSQCLDIQNFLYDSIMALREGCTNAQANALVMDPKNGVVLHKLAGAWDTIVERARILRGRPLPGSLRPGKRQARREPKGIPDPVKLPRYGSESIPGCGDTKSIPGSMNQTQYRA